MATIPDMLRYTAQRMPEAEAVVHANLRLTYAELDSRVDDVARVLVERGITSGDRVALMCGNSAAFVLAMLGALRAGAIFVPVNPASAPPEVEHILRDSETSVFLVDPKVSTAADAVADRGLQSLREIMSLGPSESYEDLLALADTGTSGVSVDVRLDEADDALILYTSGTTGLPKGALFDHHRTLWTAVAVQPIVGLRERESLLHAAPLYHAAELCILLIPGLLVGAKHVILDAFEPGAVLRTMAAEKTTVFFGVPTMYRFLLDHPESASTDLTSWRVGLFGAAPMPGSLVVALSERFRDVELVQLCGQTEGGPGGIYSNAQQVAERPDASGRQALPMSSCRVVDLDGADVSDGEVGELILRSENMMKGYWRNPEATAQTVRDGWLYTGDLARKDADGYMKLVDRLKDLIISGGRNVYSVEVENALAGHAGVLECAVVGREHEEYGESIIAYVVPSPGQDPTSEDLREHCTGLISRYKIPHEFVRCEALPRNASGKILKRALRTDTN